MDLYKDEPNDGYVFNDAPTDLESGPDLVKAGVRYEELSPMHEAALKAYNYARHDIRITEGPSKAASKAKGDGMIYERLIDLQEIRVLELHPGKYSDDLRCNLHVCDVALDRAYYWPQETREGRLGNAFVQTRFVVSSATGQPVWYTALSYVWGDSAFVMPMLCDGKPFRTTRNLEAALRHLRHTEDSVILWADQICIDQNDLQEKTQQVLLMSKIYERARNTVVWLGVEADNSNSALETLLDIRFALRYHSEEKAPDVEDFARLSLPQPDSPKWSDLREFLSRPWFHRVWVLQEAVLQRRVEMVCGSRCISWHDMAMFAYFMVNYDLEQFMGLEEPAEGELSESTCVRIKMISDMKDYYHTSIQKSSLFAVLTEGRGAKATDLRDKVFGVMGMSDQILYPDYQRSVPDVYREACQPCLNASDIVRLLCSVDHDQPVEGMPSWVPDWSTPRQTVSLGFTDKEHAVYKAATWDADFAGYRLKSIKIEKNHSLIIEGVMFDSISNVCGPAKPTLQDLLVESSARDFVVQCVRMAIAECAHYISKTGLFEAFWRTVVAGKDHTGVLQAPGDYAEIFALLLDTASGVSPTLPDQPHFKRMLTTKSLESRRPYRLFREIQIAYKAAMRGRNFGTTSKGYMGLFPRGTQYGDRICVFLGAPLPFILRSQRSSGQYRLIGECYVHGIMDGEVLKMVDVGPRDITII